MAEEQKADDKKFKAQRKILALFRKCQKTKDRANLVKIQEIVDEIGEPFCLEIEDPKQRIYFKPTKEKNTENKPTEKEKKENSTNSESGV